MLSRNYSHFIFLLCYLQHTLCSWMQDGCLGTDSAFQEKEEEEEEGGGGKEKKANTS